MGLCIFTWWHFAWFIAAPGGGKVEQKKKDTLFLLCREKHTFSPDTKFHTVTVYWELKKIKKKEKRKRGMEKQDKKKNDETRRGKRRVEISGENSWQFHAAGTFAKDFCYDARHSTKLLFLLETFMPGSLNAVICEGWNQRTVLSYELNFFSLFLYLSLSLSFLFVLHEGWRNSSHARYFDRIKRPIRFRWLLRKRKFMQRHFHARTSTRTKLLEILMENRKKKKREREREKRIILFSNETTTLFLGIYLQQVFSRDK